MLAAGSVLTGHYVIEGILAQGGMATFNIEADKITYFQRLLP